MRKPDRPKFGVIFRCAIYTRKSSDDGLEQEFNSLDAQREACEAYVTSQRHAGWIALTSPKCTTTEASRAGAHEYRFDPNRQLYQEENTFFAALPSLEIENYY